MTKSKGGAPKGNKNALKHGIFSQFITLADDKAMASMKPEDRKDNLAMARVAFAIAWKERLKAEDAKTKLAWDFAAHYWLDSVNTYQIQAEEKAETANEVWDTISEAIRAANDKQRVKR